MKRNGKWWIFGFCLAAVSVGLVLYLGGRSLLSDSSSYRVTFARGVYHYTLSYRTKQQGNLYSMPQAPGAAAGSPGTMVAGELTLKAKVELRSYGGGYGAGGEHTLVAFALADCAGALHLLGQDVWPTSSACASQFRGRALLAEIDRRGVVQRVLPDPEATALVNDTLQTLLAELSLAIQPPDREWRATETTPHGEAESQYALEGEWGASEVRLQRKRSRYQSLNINQAREKLEERVTSSHAIRLARDGHWLGLTGTERIAAQSAGRNVLEVSTEIELRFVSKDAFDAKPPDLGKRRARTLADRGIHEQTERQLLEQRTQGLTFDEVKRVVAEFGNAGQVPEHSRFLWRLTGLLKLHPEDCKQLEPLFLDGAATTKRKALLLDVLADVGHPEAQATLRRLLESEPATRDPNYALLLQRFSFLKNPEPESVRWVEARYDRGVLKNDWNERHASAYTLGSLAEELRGAGRTAEAERINRKLQQGLSQAASARETSHALNALGATGRPENLSTILDHATNTHGTVRSAVVFGLGRLQSPEATRALVELVSDPLVTVQARAARALEKRRLSPAELQGIGRAIEAGALHEQNVRALTDIGIRHLETPRTSAPTSTSQAALALLRAVLASGAADAKTRAAIRRLIRT